MLFVPVVNELYQQLLLHKKFLKNSQHQIQNVCFYKLLLLLLTSEICKS